MAGSGDAEVDLDDLSEEELRELVEERYDFEDFGPADMAEMTAEEWEAAFDPDAWITGTRLLDRIEADLADRVRRREVFAVIERVEIDGRDRVLAYTDAGYAMVDPEGNVEGFGTVFRDVKPVVAQCSMPEYDPPERPDGQLLPDPDEVAGGSGELGNRVMQAVAAVQLLAGASLLAAPFVVDFQRSGSTLLTTVAGLGFLLIGGVILVLVANARLSDRFRAEEYRDRLRAAGVGSDERPEFVPVGDDEP